MLHHVLHASHFFSCSKVFIISGKHLVSEIIARCRKQVLDREYREALEDLPDESTRAKEKMSKEWREEIFNLQHRAALTRGALEREQYKNNYFRTAAKERKKTKAFQTGLIGLLKFGVVVVLAVFSKFAMQLFHTINDDFFGADEYNYE